MSILLDYLGSIRVKIATLVVATLLEYLEAVSKTLQGILALELEEVYRNTIRYLQIRISYFEN